MAIDVQYGMPLLAVYDVPTAVAFYRDVLGFQVAQTSPPFDDAKDNYGWALLRKNHAVVMLNNMYENNVRPPQPDAVRSAHHGDTTIYFMDRDVDATAAYLKAQGVTTHGPVDTYYGMLQVSIHDPDGYSLIFQWPVGQNKEAPENL